ncbi:MAG: DUF2911 domain-containing protein [Flammeovirgaceae bacterium]
MKRFALKLMIVTIGLIGCQSKKNTVVEDSKDSSKVIESKKDETTVIEAQSSTDDKKGSIKAKAQGNIAGADIQVSYYSPSVRGRIIWGGLVPFGQVWVTGAHSATSIEFTKDLIIDGKTVVAGKYAFFTIPNKDAWVVIINKNWRQHLADQYDDKQDVIRVSVKPETEEKLQERLRYVIEEGTGNEGEIVVYWEKLEIALPFKVK